MSLRDPSVYHTRTRVGHHDSAEEMQTHTHGTKHNTDSRSHTRSNESPQISSPHCAKPARHALCPRRPLWMCNDAAKTLARPHYFGMVRGAFTSSPKLILHCSVSSLRVWMLLLPVADLIVMCGVWAGLLSHKPGRCLRCMSERMIRECMLILIASICASMARITNTARPF